MDLFAGIDWASDHHDVLVLNQDCIKEASFRAEHSFKGIETLCADLKKLAQGDLNRIGIAIETSHGLLIAALLEAGFNVYPVNPREVENRRKISGAKTDPIDAKILAKMLRADYQDLRKLVPDNGLIVELRQLTRDQNSLIVAHTAVMNQFRACLLDYYLVLVGLFTELDSPITIAFLREYPTPAEARAASIGQLAEFLKANRYPKPNENARRIYSKLHEPQLEAKPAIVRAKSRLALALAEQLQVLAKQVKAYDKEIVRLFKTHSDNIIYSSLPGAGERLAPRMLAEWGDNRDKFNLVREPQALAGTSPTPYQSGKLSRPHFRWSCVKNFRYAMHTFAWQSTLNEPWAREYYDAQRRRGKAHHQAIRALANVWIRIIFAMWKRNEPYNRKVFLDAQSAHRRLIA